MQRVADFIADYVHALGVRHVFMVSGGGMMFLSDGLAKQVGLEVVCNHHEQASAMAAVGYAKSTGGFGVAYVTTGCGGTNAITGLLDAWQDSVPCLFISGQCKRKETVRKSGLKLRQLGVQEADILAVVKPLTKYAEMVDSPEDVAWHLDLAVHLARQGRPGPVWLDIPLDVQGATVDETALRRFTAQSGDGVANPAAAELETVEVSLARAQRPVIVAGQGIRLSGALGEFRNFVESRGIPVVASRLGIDLLPSDHPLFVGRIGNKGDRAGNFAVQNADLVLAIGSRLSVSSTGHEYDTFAREARVVVVDIDPVEHSKNTVRIDQLLICDAGWFLRSVGSGTSGRYEAWVATCLRWKRQWPVCLPEYADDSRGINLYWFVDRLCRQLPEAATIVSDAGSAFYVVAQAGQFREGQRWITSGGQADMGFTLPACVGVSCAGAGGPVVGITGDGSLQMNLQELQTVVHNRLPVKLFVWNNDGYLSIRATQSKFFEGRFMGTDSSSGLSLPATEKLANAYGIAYRRISSCAHLDLTIAEVLAKPGPAICEVMCIRDQEIVPSVASARRADGSMVSRPIEDMYPFLDRETFRREMIVAPLEE